MNGLRMYQLVQFTLKSFFDPKWMETAKSENMHAPIAPEIIITIIKRVSGPTTKVIPVPRRVKVMFSTNVELDDSSALFAGQILVKV